MAASNLPIFVQNDFSNSDDLNHLRHQTSMLQSFHNSSARSTNTMQPASEGSFGMYSHNQPNGYNNHHAALADGNNYASSYHESVGFSLYERSFQFQEDSQNMAGADNLSQLRGRYFSSPLNLPFRPVEPQYTSVDGRGNEVFGSSSFGTFLKHSFTSSEMLNGGAHGMPHKMKNSPHSLPLAAAIHQMDTLRHHHVQDQAWSSPLDDNNASSPSSVDTHSHGPLTPANLDPDPVHIDATRGDGCFYSSDIMEATNSAANTATRNDMGAPAQLQTNHFTFHSSQCRTCGGMFATCAPAAPVGCTIPAQTLSHDIERHEITRGMAVYQPPVDHSRYAVYGSQIAAENPHAHPAASVPEDLELSAADTMHSGSDTESVEGSQFDMNDLAVSNATHRQSRDRYLLKMRKQGYSYKEIKHAGRFNEAESTLRGRVRVLTKKKDERVRKPKWTTYDLDLLQRTFDLFTSGNAPSDGGLRDRYGRVPWKKISDYMAAHGGSYPFGPANCAKKWKEVMRVT